MLINHKLCSNDNPNVVTDAASDLYLCNYYEFPARMDDDSDSTTSENSGDGSTPPDDEAQQEQQEGGDDDFEMIHPVDWNVVNRNLTIPSHKLI